MTDINHPKFFMTRKLGWNIPQPKEPEMFYIERHPGETRAEFEVRRKQMAVVSPQTITLTCKPCPTGDGWILGVTKESLTTLHHVPSIDDASLRAALEQAVGVPSSAIDVQVSVVDVNGICAGLADMGRHILPKKYACFSKSKERNMANKRFHFVPDYVGGWYTISDGIYTYTTYSAKKLEESKMMAFLAAMRELELRMSDEHPTESHEMDTPANKSAKETIDHITGGRVHPEIRKNLRGVLDKADAPPAGREKADGAVGRAIRLGGV